MALKELMKRILFMFSLLAASAATADEIIIGGTTDYATGGAGVHVDYNFGDLPSEQRWAGGFTAVARVDLDGDAFIGAGYMGRRRLGERFFLDIAFSPGFYREGATDLGSSFMFRSSGAIGYDLTDSSFLSFGIDHYSNADLVETNPGAESYVLRYGMRF